MSRLGASPWSSCRRLRRRLRVTVSMATLNKARLCGENSLQPSCCWSAGKHLPGGLQPPAPFLFSCSVLKATLPKLNRNSIIFRFYFKVYFIRSKVTIPWGVGGVSWLFSMTHHGCSGGVILLISQVGKKMIQAPHLPPNIPYLPVFQHNSISRDVYDYGESDVLLGNRSCLSLRSSSLRAQTTAFGSWIKYFLVQMSSSYADLLVALETRSLSS